MKKTIIALLSLAVIGVSTPAMAGGDWLTRLTNDTNRDFEAVKRNFRAAYTAGYGSWESYGKATGFSIKETEARIKTRRAVLQARVDTADRKMDSRTRGLVKMLIRDLDQINLSVLALIRDDRGYEGYIRTTDAALVGPLSGWQEGIRQSISELRRSLKMVSTIKARHGVGAPITQVTVQ